MQADDHNDCTVAGALPSVRSYRFTKGRPIRHLGRGELLSHRRRTAGTPDPSDELPVTHIVTTTKDAHVALEQARLVDGQTAPRLLDAAVSAAHEPTLLWIGCSGCSGETQALLGVEGQALDLVDLIDVDGLRLLWHPSLAEQDLWPVYDDLMAGRERLTVLCVEGSIALAEDGMFDIAGDVGKFEVVRSLCELADYVVAMGACAAYGGLAGAAAQPERGGGSAVHPRRRRRTAAPGVALPGRAAGHHAGRMPGAGRHAGRRAALGVERRSWWPWPVRHRADGSALPAQHRVPGLRDTEADRAALHGLHRPEVPQLRLGPSPGAVGRVSRAARPRGDTAQRGRPAHLLGRAGRTDRRGVVPGHHVPGLRDDPHRPPPRGRAGHHGPAVRDLLHQPRRRRHRRTGERLEHRAAAPGGPAPQPVPRRRVADVRRPPGRPVLRTRSLSPVLRRARPLRRDRAGLPAPVRRVATPAGA